MQPQVRLIFPIFNRPRPVFVNLNSHSFFVPGPTSPKSQTIFSKEILVDCLSAVDWVFGEIPEGIVARNASVGNLAIVLAFMDVGDCS